MENNTAVSSSTLPSEAKPITTKATKQSVKKTKQAAKSAKKPKTAKTVKSAKPKKSSSALTKTLKLSDTMQERLDKFRKHIKRGVATRTELKAANLKLFR